MEMLVAAVVCSYIFIWALFRNAIDKVKEYKDWHEDVKSFVGFLWPVLLAIRLGGSLYNCIKSLTIGLIRLFQGKVNKAD
jgi:hypothetical protein